MCRIYIYICIHIYLHTTIHTRTCILFYLISLNCNDTSLPPPAGFSRSNVYRSPNFTYRCCCCCCTRIYIGVISTSFEILWSSRFNSRLDIVFHRNFKIKVVRRLSFFHGIQLRYQADIITRNLKIFSEKEKMTRRRGEMKGFWYLLWQF